MCDEQESVAEQSPQTAVEEWQRQPQEPDREPPRLSA
jgi:hypothetical protein